MSADGAAGGGAAATASAGTPMRARKPYTITKAREKWTPDEHARFIEAIKLFGRHWKKIEGARGARGAGPGGRGRGWAGR
jgi:hypothetical protein